MVDADQLPALRALRADETELLVRATLGNVNWSGPRFTVDQVLRTPALVRYFEPWRGERDFGVVVEASPEGPVGVAWARYFTASDPGYGFVDEAIPEVSVWVAEARRGAGLGTRLLEALIQEARSRDLPGLSLSVESGNPVRGLYERVGFEQAGSDFDSGTLVLRV